MPFPLCRRCEESLWCSIPLRDILIRSWPKSSISALGTFTRRDQLSSAVQCYTSVACNIYHATHKGAFSDIAVANNSPALAMNQREDSRWCAWRKKILRTYNEGSSQRYCERIFKRLQTAARIGTQNMTDAFQQEVPESIDLSIYRSIYLFIYLSTNIVFMLYDSNRHKLFFVMEQMHPETRWSNRPVPPSS